MQTVVFTFSTVFLYAKIVALGDYVVTIGGVMTGVIVAVNVYANRNELRWTRSLVVAIAAPIFIYTMHLLVGSNYAIDPGRFGLSFGLWTVSTIVIWCSFQRHTVVGNPNVLWSLVILGVLGAVQYFGETVFHTEFGYRLVEPFVNIDFRDSYVIGNEGTFNRAIGTYYEPSMFGRVSITLITMLFMKTRSLIQPLAFFALSLVTIRSLGMLALGGLNISLLFREFPRRFIYMIAGLALCLTILPTFIVDRIQEADGDVGPSSTYIRLVLPLEPLGELLYEYPFGLPIGSNAKFVENTLAKNYGLEETKITNGLYELVLYFGLVAVIGIVVSLYYMIRAASRKQTTTALIIAYLLLSTAVSSSYLSIESSLLTYFFIASMRSLGRSRQFGAINQPAAKVIYSWERAK